MPSSASATESAAAPARHIPAAVIRVQSTRKLMLGISTMRVIWPRMVGLGALVMVIPPAPQGARGGRAGDGACTHTAATQGLTLPKKCCPVNRNEYSELSSLCLAHLRRRTSQGACLWGARRWL